MNLQINEGNPTNRRRWLLHGITGALLILLVGFTLLSNTLFAMTLPKVTTQVVSPGSLDQTHTGHAVIEPVEARELTGKAGSSIKQVLVHVGDVVLQGQNLVEYDIRDGERQLEAEQAQLSKLQLSIKQLEYAYILAEQNGEPGSILAAKAALEIAKIDIDMQQRHIEDLQQSLSSNRWLKAPFDGRVMAVNAREGIATSAGTTDIRLEHTSRGYQLVLPLPADIAVGLSVGETLDVRLLRPDNRVIPGHIVRLVTSTESKEQEAVLRIRMTVTMQDPSLEGGEQAEMTVTLKGKAGTLLLSKSAIRTDSAGTFVYTIEERRGPLGNAFYAKRREVTVVGSNELVASISKGLFAQEAVIIESSEPLLDGSRVRVLTR